MTHSTGHEGANALALLAPLEAAHYRPAGLTPREGDVVHWLSCGKTDAEIAALLRISPRTVHKHLEHVYVKLGVETRTAAVMRLLAIGLDAAPPWPPAAAARPKIQPPRSCV